MPYTAIRLSDLVTQISTIVDDTTQVYWTVAEIQYAIWEALRVWGAYTNYWRSRGTFQVTPTDSSPFYYLPALLPTLRSQSWTLDQMTQEIQFMLLENPSGVAGTGMSGQVSIGTILTAIQRARNRFVLDTRLPLTYHPLLKSTMDAFGMLTIDSATVFIHRAGWVDNYSSLWYNLWRQDEWTVDKSNLDWTLNPTTPQSFSEAESAPLKIQLMPPPISDGVLDGLTVDSIQFASPNVPGQLFFIPDEWTHAVKYAALSDILTAGNQIKDDLRAQYAESRYKQAVAMALNAKSISRVLVNNTPVPLDTLQAIDAGYPYWRNQQQPPSIAASLYDFLVIPPVDQTYGVAVDLVQTAILPSSGDYIQLGQEDMDHIVEYAISVLMFKCGGNEFKSTLAGYDSFMKAVASRNEANAAKIQYLAATLGQPAKEWGVRPERVKLNA